MDALGNSETGSSRGFAQIAAAAALIQRRDIDRVKDSANARVIEIKSK
jgi:hypothetical protein